MVDEMSDVLLEGAIHLLILIDAMQKAEELKNSALTTADWAKRKKLADGAIQSA